MALEDLDSHGRMLRDTILLLREEMRETNGGSDYEAGKRFGLGRAIDLFQQQASAFGLNEADLWLADFDLVKELADHKPVENPE